MRQMPRLKNGQVLALGSRQVGSNGLFEEGDIGVGHMVDEDKAEIQWPNGTVTRTSWPNESWYYGRPFLSPNDTAEDDESPEEDEDANLGTIEALSSRTGDNGKFEKGDAGHGYFIGEGRVEIVWPNGTITKTVWPNTSWYAGTPVPLEAMCDEHEKETARSTATATPKSPEAGSSQP